MTDHKLAVHSVMSPEFHKRAETQVVTQILKRHGYDYHPFVDNLWFGWPSKLHRLINVLVNEPELTGDATHLMFIDARDVVVLDSPDEVMKRYFAFNHPWVYNAEPFIWSQESFQPEDYPTPGCRYRYLNAGASIGEIEHMRKWMSLWTNGGELPMEIVTDQDWMAHRFVESWPYAIMLDHNCDLFQCMCGSDVCTEVSPGRIHNTLTGTSPIIIHYNGGTDITTAADSNAGGINRRILWDHWL